ncbi:MAG: glycosyltransferase family 39 protein, partial [Myxococcota bacterium]
PPSLDGSEMKRDAAVAVGLAAAKIALHVPVLGRYGWHRDELYFVDCGLHPAWGYVDHAPLVPWVAGAATALVPGNLIALRLPAVLAGALAVALTARVARALGAGTAGQLLAGGCMLVGPAYLRMAKILHIPAFEVLWWTLASLLLVQVLLARRPRLWLAIGAVMGLALLTKPTALLWIAGCAVGLLLVPEARAHLRSPWPYAGAAVALALVAPSLLWQHESGWPTIDFIVQARQGMLARIPRALFLLGQVLYIHPFTVPVWAAGLVWLIRRGRGPLGVLVWLFVVPLGLLLVTRGKPYYLAPAYPVLFAAGGTAIEAYAGRVRSRLVIPLGLATLLLGGTISAPLALPYLPLRRVDALAEKLFGWAVPARALTHDLHDEHGWRQQVAAADAAHRALPNHVRDGMVLLVGNYGQASAARVLGHGRGLPPVLSGHMTHHLWSARLLSEREAPVSAALAYGLPRRTLEDLFAHVRRIDHIRGHPLAEPEERDLPIHLCTSPHEPLDEAWPRLRRFRHGPP